MHKLCTANDTKAWFGAVVRHQARKRIWSDLSYSFGDLYRASHYLKQPTWLRTLDHHY